MSDTNCITSLGKKFIFVLSCKIPVHPLSTLPTCMHTHTHTHTHRWREHTHHLELWVEIMELNEQGEYESVETQTKADVLTGGVFMMRQVGIILTCDMIVMSYNIP